MSDIAASLFLLLQIFFLDLLLGADNAIVIAIACGRREPEDTRRAVIFGAAGAIALRLAMLLFANALLGVPLVKIVGAWTLLVIALNVRTQDAVSAAETAGRRTGAQDFLSAAVIIMFADAAMSLDNVVALAAIAGGAFWLLTLGVLMSIPILVYGAVILTRIMRFAPEIFVIGAAFLGWIAGAMAVTDPLVAGWVDANAPALGIFAPALGALFVLAAGKGVPRPAVSTSSAAPAAAPVPPRQNAYVLADVPRVRDKPPPLAPPPRVVARIEPRSPPVAPPPVEDALPGFASEEPAPEAHAGLSEERLVVAGFILLAVLAGLIIFIASFYDSLT